MQPSSLIRTIMYICGLSFFKSYNNHLKNDGGEVKYFAINKIDNDNNQIANVWSLHNPTKTELWQEGQAEVHSDGDKMYQVKVLI